MGKFTRRIQEQTGGSGAAPQQGTYIAEASDLEGTFRFTGPAVIAGKITGNIYATELLVVEPSAVITGDIDAANMVIKGKVTGQLTASKSIELGETAKFRGTVSAPALRVKEGAEFKAAMEVSRESEADPQSDIDSLRSFQKTPKVAAKADSLIRQGDVIIPAAPRRENFIAAEH